MAATGTITGDWNTNGKWVITIAGVTSGSTSNSFSLKNSMYSSFTLSGTFGGASVQPQGSDDGGTTWTNIGVALTAAGGGTVTPGQVIWALYQYAITGGDGTTLLAIRTVGTTPR